MSGWWGVRRPVSRKLTFSPPISTENLIAGYRPLRKVRKSVISSLDPSQTYKISSTYLRHKIWGRRKGSDWKMSESNLSMNTFETRDPVGEWIGTHISTGRLCTLNWAIYTPCDLEKLRYLSKSRSFLGDMKRYEETYGKYEEICKCHMVILMEKTPFLKPKIENIL